MSKTIKLAFPYNRCPISSADVLWFYGIDVTPDNQARAVRNMATKHGWKIMLMSDRLWHKDTRL